MSKTPNLLFIFTDEQRQDTLSCYGNSFVQMPHLNALASKSTVFEHAYVTQAVCTPSRSSIMTGLYPHTNGCIANNIPLRQDTPTIAEMLPDTYACGYYGKWHLGDEIVAQHGFPDWVSIEDAYRAWYSKDDYLALRSSYHQYLEENGFHPDAQCHGASVFSRTMSAKLAEEYTKAGFVGQEASRFIEENKNTPFCLYVNFLEPHMPFTGPLNEMYDPAELPVGPEFLAPPPENHARVNHLLAAHYSQRTQDGIDLSTETGWRKLRAQYLGLCTMVDNAVGRILNTLATCGLEENTIVVFTSDHGDMMGDHGILAKTVQYEESVKVPMMIRAPQLRQPPRRVGGRVGQIDLVPTLLELMGQDVPSSLEGESLAPVLRNDAETADRDVFIEWNVPEGDSGMSDGRPGNLNEDDKRIANQCWRTVISPDGWKLNLCPGDQCELFDLTSDPYEQTNLFDTPAQQDRVRALAERLYAWQETTKDSVGLPQL